MIGEMVGSYKVIAKLGEGGMGAVYMAEHPLIGRRAAVKVLLPELCGSPEMVDRFFNEARATAQLKHPGLVDVFDFGHHKNGSAYIVMELLDGESLSARIERGPLPPAIIVAISRQICKAVGTAHAQGIVHRDLKPDNVFLVPDHDAPGGARVKVLDFGIAKLMKGSAATSRKTETGTMLGTPMYMSPEQCRGAGEIDLRTDVYALGCIMFEMACGRPPFVMEGSGSVVAAHIHEKPPRPTTIEPSVPADLEALILRMLEKQPQDRPQSMSEVARALDGEPLPPDEPSKGRIRMAALAGAILLVGASAIGVRLVRARPSVQPTNPAAASPPPAAASQPQAEPTPTVTLSLEHAPITIDVPRLRVTPLPRPRVVTKPKTARRATETSEDGVLSPFAP